MGRAVRRVPKDWKHPKEVSGDFRPLFEGPFSERLAEWEEGAAQWEKGLRKNWGTGEYVPKDADARRYSYEEWAGGKPIQEDYMPEWDESERTHIQMYETCTEGTPISPVRKTPEELARWLADNKASAFGRETATYEQWLRVCRGGYAPSAVVQLRKDGGGNLMSGVAALEEIEESW